MSKKARVDNSHFRVTKDDGSESYLYETNGWSTRCVEITEHHKDGNSDAYEVDNSLGGFFRGLFLGDVKGKHK